jgi:hypothetical protein
MWPDINEIRDCTSILSLSFSKPEMMQSNNNPFENSSSKAQTTPVPVIRPMVSDKAQVMLGI